LYVDKTWVVGKVDENYPESFETWCKRRTEKIIWTDCVRNEEVLHRVTEDRNVIHAIKRRKFLLEHNIEGG
jgi:hypothetical protein